MLRFIPTPSKSFVELGPFTIHFYALAILVGIAVAYWVGRFRYTKVGGNPSDLSDVVLWAVPFGILGGRLYHVITSPDAYFGKGGHPIDAFKIWQGGMGIWGAIFLGFLAAYIGYRRKPRSRSFGQLADALAPGLLLAQAIGRWGNWFNGELFGRPTKLPWGLEIPLQLRPAGFEEYATFHPTFLYESLWCIAGALILIYFPFFKTMPPAYTFIGYITLYTAGRTWIELLRIDQAHHVFGLRLNVWVSGVIFFLSLMALIRMSRMLARS